MQINFSKPIDCNEFYAPDSERKAQIGGEILAAAFRLFELTGEEITIINVPETVTFKAKGK